MYVCYADTDCADIGFSDWYDHFCAMVCCAVPMLCQLAGLTLSVPIIECSRGSHRLVIAVVD